MDAAEGVGHRLEIVEQLLAAPPAVHPDAPNRKVWSTDRRCYEFMAREVRPGYRTLETGAGISTVLLTAWGCTHVAVVPFPHESEVILDYCSEHGIDTSALTFDLRPSEVALPEMLGAEQLDLVFIDGAHAFPLPIIDWFYGAGLLRKGGIVVFDDVQLPAVGAFLDSYVERDDRWQHIDGTAKWRAYRRQSEGSLSEHESNQPFFAGPQPPVWKRAARSIWHSLPLGVRRLLRPH